LFVGSKEPLAIASLAISFVSALGSVMPMLKELSIRMARVLL